MLTFTDTHCHLDITTFDADRQMVLTRARQAGLIRILNPGLDLESSRAAVRLAQQVPEVYAAVGVHPNSALTWDDDTYRALQSLAQEPKVVAIGEIGLDYYRKRAPVDLQKRIFKCQLDLAAELGLPVVIHNRQATGDVLDILAGWQADLVKSGSDLARRPGVLHSFSGVLEDAHAAVAKHFRIGITGPVTFKNAPDLQEVVQHLALDHLLIETDAPFLAPHPYRGRRNEPAYVRYVASKIGELQGEAVEMVARRTTENAHQLFRWGMP